MLPVYPSPAASWHGRRWAAAGRPGRAGVRRLVVALRLPPPAGASESAVHGSKPGAARGGGDSEIPGLPQLSHKTGPPPGCVPHVARLRATRSQAPAAAAVRGCETLPGQVRRRSAPASAARGGKTQNESKGSALSSLTGGHSAIVLCFSRHHSVDKIVLLVPDRPDSESGQSSDSSLMAVTRAQKAIAISQPPVRFPNSTHQSVLLAYIVGRRRRRGWNSLEEAESATA
jgi:hypothetical protein